jgi:hypothetical protein
MIRKLKTGRHRLYARKKNAKTGKRQNLGTFSSRRAAEAHERAVHISSIRDLAAVTRPIS